MRSPVALRQIILLESGVDLQNLDLHALPVMQLPDFKSHSQVFGESSTTKRNLVMDNCVRVHFGA